SFTTRPDGAVAFRRDGSPRRERSVRHATMEWRSLPGTVVRAGVRAQGPRQLLQAGGRRAFRRLLDERVQRAHEARLARPAGEAGDDLAPLVDHDGVRRAFGVEAIGDLP